MRAKPSGAAPFVTARSFVAALPQGGTNARRFLSLAANFSGSADGFATQPG
jgi:hypothetical protein